MINQNQASQSMTTKLYMNKLQIKTDHFNLILNIRVAQNKKTNHPQDYLLADMINQNQPTQSTIIRLFIINQPIRTNHSKPIQHIRAALKKKNNHLLDYLQEGMINLNQRIQNMIIKQFIISQQIKKSLSNQTQLIREVQKKKKHLPLDFHQVDMINQNQQTQNMITKQSIINLLIKINHSNQIQLIKVVQKKKNNLLQDYPLADMTNRNQQIQNMIIRRSITNLLIRTSLSNPTQHIKAARKKKNSLQLDYHLEDTISLNQLTLSMIIKLFIINQPIKTSLSNPTQHIKVAQKKKNHLLLDCHQADMINQNQHILIMIIRQSIINLLTKTNRSNPIPHIREVRKKKNNLLPDYHQADMINPNLKILTMITKQFTINQPIKKNHIKQTQIINKRMDKKKIQKLL